MKIHQNAAIKRGDIHPPRFYSCRITIVMRCISVALTKQYMYNAPTGRANQTGESVIPG